jgi:hypothetical protein
VLCSTTVSLDIHGIRDAMSTRRRRRWLCSEHQTGIRRRWAPVGGPVRSAESTGAQDKHCQKPCSIAPALRAHRLTMACSRSHDPTHMVNALDRTIPSGGSSALKHLSRVSRAILSMLCSEAPEMISGNSLCCRAVCHDVCQIISSKSHASSIASLFRIKNRSVWP